MYTHLFLDTTQVVNATDTLRNAIYTVSQHTDIAVILKTITAIVGLSVPFIFSLIVVIIVFNNKYKKDKLQAQERMKMIEKGMMPPSVTEKKYSIVIDNNGKPIATWIKLLLGFGAGLFLGMIFDKIGFDDKASYFSMIFICTGTMLIFGDKIFAFQTHNQSKSLDNQPPILQSKKEEKKSISSLKVPKKSE